MSKPLRITCHTKADLPPLEEIRRLVTREQHLVLQFPATEVSLLPDKVCSFIKRRRVASLARRLPEYSVFDSGGRSGVSEWITIKSVISQELVLAHAQTLVDAARQFRKIAHEVISLLAEKFGVSAEAINERFRFGLSDDLYSGDLSDNWHYFFHGYECRFQSERTKQVLDVKLDYPNERGVLDAYFFYEFLQTTPDFKEIADLFADGYHDTSRALDILEKKGLLRLIIDSSGKRRGRVAQA